MPRTRPRRRLKPQAGYRRALPALKERRLELGLSADDVAKQVPMPVETLYRVEARRLRAAHERQEALARRYTCAVEDLFSPTEPLPTAERDAAIVASYRRLGSAEKAGAEHGVGKKAALAALARAGVSTRDRAGEKQERLWAVAVLEVYAVPRTKMRNVLADELGIRISQSQLYLDLHELGYGQRRPGSPAEEKICKTCGEPFTAYDAWRRGSRWPRRFCSDECWQDSPDMIRACARGHERRWGDTRMFGRHSKTLAAAKGKRVGAETLAKTAEEHVRKAGLVALDCYRRSPDIARGDLVALVVLRLEGRDAVFSPVGLRRDSRDPVRQAAERRVVRRLKAACTLEDFAGTLLAHDFG
jgi:hypothetical protein